MIQRKKSEIINSKWQWQKICSFNIGLKYIILNSKAIHSKLFRPRSTISILKSAKYQNQEKFVAEIFKVKIGLSPELMSDIFEFIEKPYSGGINSKFRPEFPNDKTCHKNRKYNIESFSKWM